VATATTTANVAAAATVMVIAANDYEGSSGEVVTTAGNGGCGGDRHCARCKGRGSEVIGVDETTRTVVRMPGEAKGTWVMLDCAQ
jgi:hypothetical protein